MLIDPKSVTDNDAFEKAAAPKREALRKHIATQRAEILKVARGKVAEYLVAVATKPADQLEDAVFFRSLSPGDLRVQFLNNWRRLLRQHASPNNAIFGPWHQAMALGENEFATSATKLLSPARIDGVAKVSRGFSMPPKGKLGGKTKRS